MSALSTLVANIDKPVGGAAYTLMGIVKAFSLEPYECRLSIPGEEPVEGAMLFMAVGNSRLAGGGFEVVIQDLAGGQQLSIFETAWIRSLRWSPGGSELLGSAGSTDDQSQTYLVSRLGGSTRPLRYLPFAAWSPDGKRYAGTTLSGKQIWFIDTSTGSASSVELTGEYLGESKDPWGGTRIGFEATTTINRKDFGLNWNVALEAGGFLVGEDVDIVLEIQAVRQ